jgi:hypothetical protein
MMTAERLITDLKPTKSKAPKQNMFGAETWLEWCRQQVYYMQSRGMRACVYFENNENEIQFCAVAPFDE